MRPKQYLALRNIMVEFFGTLALVYFSNWANLLYELKMLSLAGYGIVYGLILSLLIYIGLDTSGGHYDPSVTVKIVLSDTLAELLDRKQDELWSCDSFLDCVVLGRGVCSLPDQNIADTRNAR